MLALIQDWWRSFHYMWCVFNMEPLWVGIDHDAALAESLALPCLALPSLAQPSPTQQGRDPR